MKLIIRNEEVIDKVIEEVVKKYYKKTDTEIELFESLEELKFPQEFEDGGNIILDDLNKKGMKDPRVQARFKRDRHNNLFIFIVCQDYYELPKRTIRANQNIHHIFKPNNFREVQNLHQDKASTDMLLNELRHLINVCWNKKYHPLSIDMTWDKYTG